MVLNEPLRCTSITIFQSMWLMRWKMRSRRMPALLITPSILPKFSTAALTMRSAPAGSATLSPLATALPPAALISSTTFCAGVVLPPPSPSTAPPRSLTTTAAPSLAASSAISRPMPPPAPVTSTTLPLSLSVMGVPLFVNLQWMYLARRPAGSLSRALVAEVAAQRTAKRHFFLQSRHARVVVPEGVADLVERDVGEHAAIGEVERVVDRIRLCVPIQRLQPEPGRQLLVEGGRRLHPPSVEPDLGVAVIIKGVAAHQLAEPPGRHVVAHVRVTHARSNADGPTDRRHQARLVDAVAMTGRERGAGAIGFALHRRVVGVVAQIVAHGVVEPLGALAIAAIARDAPGISYDGRVIGVDQRGRRKIGLERRVIAYDIVPGRPQAVVIHVGRCLLQGATKSMSQSAQFTNAHMVRFERELTADPARVWQTLTDTRRLPGWYGEGTIEPRVGGKVELMAGHIKGVVTQWLPPRRLAYTWNVLMPGQSVSDYPESYLTLELGKGRLVLTHLPVLEQFVKLNAVGWHTYLDMVEAELAGGKVDDRGVYMKRNAERYGVDLPGRPS